GSNVLCWSLPMKVAIGAVRGRRTKSFTEISKQQIYFSIKDSTPDYHTLDSLEKVQKMTVGRGGRSHHHVASPLLAEALAIRDALLHAFSLGFTSIWLRSDAQALITAITMKRRPTELYGVLSDIDSISSLFSVCRFSFCPRASNGLANMDTKLVAQYPQKAAL
ncbi:hypothetical protein IGI04_006321, partial [Brassica rapa subsp. trilocularis]